MKIHDKVFVDTNVLVYSVDHQKPEYIIAQSRITELKNSGCDMYISPQVLREFANAVIRDALENKRNLAVTISKVQKNIDLFTDVTHFFYSFDSWVIIAIVLFQLPRPLGRGL